MVAAGAVPQWPLACADCRKDEQIAGLVQRDATVSKCKTENLELTDEIASLRETIKSQEELIRQLRGNPNVLQTKRR